MYSGAQNSNPRGHRGYHRHWVHQCLIRLTTIQKLGISMMPLAHPICFEQVDGTLIGGAPATLIIEPVRLEMGHHWELLQFVVVSRMTVSHPGLAWLDKRGSTIMWEDGYRKLKIGVGPLSPHLSEKAQQSEPPCGPSTYEKAAAVTDSLLGCPQVPKEYRDLADTISE